MGSFVEINDTLRITKEQGFPGELVYEIHKKTPFKTENFAGKVFAFTDKPNIRIYKAPPVRNFLVEAIGDKWLYWGLVHILEITHDYVNKMTSGKFTIIHLYSPDEMRQAQRIVDQDTETDYLT